MYALMLVCAARHGGLPARVRLRPPAATCRLFVVGRADALHAQLGALLRRRLALALATVVDRVRGAPELLARRAARLRRRRRCCTCRGCRRCSTRRSTRRALAQPAALRRAGPDLESRAGRRHAHGRARARRRLRASRRSSRGAWRTRSAPRCSSGARSCSARWPSRGSSRRCRPRGPRATSPRCSARCCCSARSASRAPGTLGVVALDHRRHLGDPDEYGLENNERVDRRTRSAASCTRATSCSRCSPSRLRSSRTT